MLRVFLFGFIAIFSTFFYSIVVTVCGFFKRGSAFIFYRLLKPWSRSILWAAGINLTLSGEEHVVKNQCYIIVSNHQSHLDIPILINKLPMQLTILAKKELYRIPFFAQAMKAIGIIKIDRSNRARSFKALQDASEIMKERQLSVLAFPEGTRSFDGQLKSFKKGAFVLAIQSGIPIIPISINGAYPILPKGKVAVQPGDVHVTIHPPVDVTNYTFEQRNELIDHIHDIIASGLSEDEKSIQAANRPQPSLG